MFQIVKEPQLESCVEPAPWISRIVLGPRPAGVDPPHGPKPTGAYFNRVSDTDPYYNDKVLRKIAKNAKFAQLL